jgi:hypothetical protein
MCEITPETVARIRADAGRSNPAARQERIDTLRQKRGGLRTVNADMLPDEEAGAVIDYLANRARFSRGGLEGAHPDIIGSVLNASPLTWFVFDATEVPVAAFGLLKLAGRAPAVEPWSLDRGGDPPEALLAAERRFYRAAKRAAAGLRSATMEIADA